jgi:hypothetical protein
LDNKQVSQKIIRLLCTRHADKWASFAELAAPNRQRIDFFAIATGCGSTPLGYCIVYEVKVTRADFLRELKKPIKREFAYLHSNEAYFVAPGGVIFVDELPEGWGLIEMNKAGVLKQIRAAKQRKCHGLPIEFVANIAKRTADDVPDFSQAVWRYAGEEVDLTKLIELANDEVVRSARLEVSKLEHSLRFCAAQAESDLRRQDWFIQMEEVYTIIGDTLGNEFQAPLRLKAHLLARKSPIDDYTLEQLKRVSYELSGAIGLIESLKSS